MPSKTKRPNQRASHSSPNKPTPRKRQTKLDFSSRRSTAGSSSSPAKSQRDYEGSETDASSGVNEIQFETGVAGTRKRATSSSSSSEGEVEIIDLESTDDEKEEAVLNKGKGRSKVVEDSDEEEAVSEEEEEDEMPVRRTGKRKVVAISMTPTSDDEVENKNSGRIVRRGHDPVAEESEEEDIMDGLDKDRVLQSRLRSAPTRNSKIAEVRENLARLKRRKLGKDTPPVHSPTPSESSSDSEEEEAVQVVRPRGKRVYKPIPGAQPTLQDFFGSGGLDHAGPARVVRQNDASDVDDDESDSQESWIEDDGGEANVPVLPEGYSMLGHQSLGHHFKVVMQMFVHFACMKARKRWAFKKDEENDQYFGVSLRALTRKLDGMRDSLVASSVWTSGFKKALNSYPELTIFELGFAVPGCGACRISSRMSTYRGALDGDSYNRDTFEKVTRDEDSDEELPMSFDLGRFCQARVRCYHDFVHWEWQLLETISDEIEILRTARLRNDPVQPGRPEANDPDGIMAWLDRRGVVEREWRRVEELMKSARGLEFGKGNEDQ